MNKLNTRSNSSNRRSWAASALATIGLLTLVGCGAKDSTPMEDPTLDIEEARRRHAETMAAQTASGTIRDPEGEPATFDSKLEAGDQLRAAGDPARALWAYIQAQDLEPNAIEPKTRIGLLQLEADPDRAASIFAEVLETNRDSAVAHFGLGLAYIARDQPEKAYPELVYADTLSPNNPAILAARGSLEERLGRRDSAIRLLRRAHTLRPSDPDILNNLGILQLLDGKVKQATRIFERATLLHPDDSILQNNLGLAHGLAGNYELALKAFSKTGDHRTAYNNLGYVYFLNGEFDDALAEYEKALLAQGDTNLEAVLKNIEAAVTARDQKAGPAALSE